MRAVLEDKKRNIKRGASVLRVRFFRELEITWNVYLNNALPRKTRERGKREREEKERERNNEYLPTL